MRDLRQFLKMACVGLLLNFGMGVGGHDKKTQFSWFCKLGKKCL